MKKLGLAKLNAFDVGTHGQFFWNFRTEFDSTWDYQKAVALGWLPNSFDSIVLKDISRGCVVKPIPPVDYSIFKVHHNALALMLCVLVFMVITMVYPTRHRWLASCFGSYRVMKRMEYTALPSSPESFKQLLHPNRCASSSVSRNRVDAGGVGNENGGNGDIEMPSQTTTTAVSVYQYNDHSPSVDLAVAVDKRRFHSFGEATSGESHRKL